MLHGDSGGFRNILRNFQDLVRQRTNADCLDAYYHLNPVSTGQNGVDRFAISIQLEAPVWKLRILLADHHPVVREGLRALIGAEPDMEVVGEAVDGPTTLEQNEELNPDVVILEISLPGLNGMQVTTALRRTHPARKILLFTFHEEQGHVRQLLETGAAGYLSKRASAEELIMAVRTVASGGSYLDPTLATEAVDNHPAPGEAEYSERDVKLSKRETEVVRLIAEGYSNKEIAGRLELSVKTVETYKMRSMEKLLLRSRVDIVRYASQRGWLTGPRSPFSSDGMNHSIRLMKVQDISHHIH